MGCHNNLVFLPVPSFHRTPTLSPPVRALVPICAASRPARKPRGYWSNLDNLRRELAEHHASTQPDRPVDSMPTAGELRTSGRTDLHNAIGAAGGYITVAKKLQLSPSKIARRPAGYWRDFHNLQRELNDFISSSTDAPGVMPTQRMLRAAGRSDLVCAFSFHGGASAVARRMELAPSATVLQESSTSRSDYQSGAPSSEDTSTSQRRRRRRRQTVHRASPGQWDEWTEVEKALLAFMRERNDNDGDDDESIYNDDDDAENNDTSTSKGMLRMPTQRELREAGRSDLAAALDRHGGLGAAAKRLGIAGARGARQYASFHRVATGVYAATHELEIPGVMPSGAVLRKSGRGSLAGAIARHGGFGVTAKRLGLICSAPRGFRRGSHVDHQQQGQCYREKGGERGTVVLKEWGALERAMRVFIERHGTSGELPSSRLLGNFGRDDLCAGVLYHGGAGEVARRMRLQRSGWSEFHEVAEELLEFCRSHGVEGVMPTEQDMRDVGRTGLQAAVGRMGYEQMAQRLGLAQARLTTAAAFELLLDGRLGSDHDDCDDVHDYDNDGVGI